MTAKKAMKMAVTNGEKAMKASLGSQKSAHPPGVLTQGSYLAQQFSSMESWSVLSFALRFFTVLK
jgi:hypothetical protein